MTHFFSFQIFFFKQTKHIISKPPLVLLLADLHSLHVVVHVHEPTQPGSVEGGIAAWWVHAHLLLIAIPDFVMNASCLRLCGCVGVYRKCGFG